MPTLLALTLASCAGFLISRIPLDLPIWAELILSAAAWLVVFIFTKRLLGNLRP